MSKITFRADDKLVDRLEALGGSKSEIMREALRNYLDDRDERNVRTVRGRQTRRTEQTETQSQRNEHLLDERSLDEMIEGRVDAFLQRRYDDESSRQDSTGQDVHVNVNLDQGQTGVNTDAHAQNTPNRRSRRVTDGQSRICRQCGELVKDTHVHCPNCGKKASHHAFCECGDEIRSDWAYCPRCGRRTPSADVLDRS